MRIININDAVWSRVSHNPTIKKRVILARGELRGVTAMSQAVFKPGDVADAHAHRDMAEVFLVQSGRGVIRINGSEHELNSHVVAVAEPNDVHEIENTGKEDLIITYFGVPA